MVRKFWAVVSIFGALGILTGLGIFRAAEAAPDGPRFIYLTPWEWVSGEGGYWRCPGGTALGAVDLRSLPEMALAGTGKGYGACVYNAPQAIVGATLLGTAVDSPIAKTEKDAVKAALNQSKLDADNPRDVVWEMLTKRADPTGQNGPKPLMPNKGKLELHLGGFSLIKSEPFSFNSEHGDMVRRSLQEDYRKIRADYPLTTAQKYLGGLALEHGKEYRFFIPAGMPDEGSLPPSTTITDNFTRADADALGISAETWSWTETTGDIDIVSNAASFQTAATSRARANYALSSTDHYAQGVITTAGTGAKVGPTVRFNASGASDTYSYYVRIGAASRHQISKIVAGVSTSLFTDNTNDAVNGDTVRLTVTGSSLSGTVNGIERVSGSDTSLTAGLRAGIELFSSTSHLGTMDNFEASDGIAVAITAVTPTKIRDAVAYTLTLTGVDFVDPMQVAIERTGQTTIACTSESVSSTTRMTAVCTFTQAADRGLWNIRVTRDNQQTAVGANLLDVSVTQGWFLVLLMPVIATLGAIALAFKAMTGGGMNTFTLVSVAGGIIVTIIILAVIQALIAGI